MIFTSVAELSNNQEKRFFKEQVDVFIRLIELSCEKYDVENREFTDLESDDYEELIKIGVINHPHEINDLRKFLKDKYAPFIKAVKFSKNNKDIVYDAIWKLYNSEREKAQEEAKNKHDLTLIDFFCGAGGLSLGFIQEGFNVKLANDIEDVCIETYKYNHPQLPSSRLIQEDIRVFIDDIDNLVDEPIDIVVGGPPCQGFSNINQRRIIDDPRNELYKYFLMMIERIAPKFVVMENVKGMLSVADQVVEDYGAIEVKKDNRILNYDVAYKILNSKDFSVAQNRERLIYIAVRSDIKEKLNIDPKDIFDKISQNNKDKKIHFLKDALSNIKPLETNRVKNTTEIDSEVSGKKIDINMDINNENDYLNLINENRQIPFLFNHKASFINDNDYEIYKRLDPGDDSTSPKIKDIMLYSSRNHMFKDKYFKLLPNKPSKTIVAHMKYDRHSYIHPYQVRAITPRESARIQSFPDDYFFLGPYTKTYMQIGNAVPPVMARGIAKVIKNCLKKLNK